MYTRFPGFAAASEWAYTFFARRRALLNRATRLLWGPVLEPERTWSPMDHGVRGDTRTLGVSVRKIASR